MSWVMVGVAVVGLVVSSQQASRAAKANARELGFQRDQGMADAEAERQGAEVRAGQIRKAGRYQGSATRAALAKGGVVVDSGTGQVLQDHVKATSEHDALTEILTGEYRAHRLESGAATSDRQISYVKQGADDAKAASIFRAGSLLAGGYSANGGWKTQAPMINDQVPGQYSTVNRQYG